MWGFIRGAWCADRSATALGVPRHARELALAIFPFRAGENARRDFDQARRQLEDREGRPGLSVPHAEGTLVEQLSHVLIRLVLDNHLSQVIENLHLGGILFEVQAIARDAGSVGNFLARA